MAEQPVPDSRRWTIDELRRLPPRELAGVYQGLFGRYEKAVLRGLEESGRELVEPREPFWTAPRNPDLPQRGALSWFRNPPRWLPYTAGVVALVTQAYIFATAAVVTAGQVAVAAIISGGTFAASYLLDRKIIRERAQKRHLHREAERLRHQAEVEQSSDLGVAKELTAADCLTDVQAAGKVLAEVMRVDGWSAFPTTQELQWLSEESAPLRRGTDPPDAGPSTPSKTLT